MSDPVKLALVGCGGIANLHVKGYEDLYGRGCRNFEYSACCDINLENAQRHAKQIREIQGSEPKVFTDLAELIGSGLAQGADIAAPHWLHHSLAVQCLEGGMHVLVEKPIGITVRATKKIIEAGEKAGRIVATAENIRRYQTCRAFRWAMSEKKMIGDVLAVQTHQVARQLPDYSSPMWKWRGLKALTGGGMIMDSGVHYADMMVHMFGELEQAICSMQTYDERIIKDAPVLGDAPADVEDAWHAVLRFKSGLEARWTFSRCFHGEPVQFAYYYGTEGTMVDDKIVFHPFQIGGTVHLADKTVLSTDDVIRAYMDTLSKDQANHLFPHGCVDGFGVQLWDFADAIQNGRKPEMDGQDGLRAKTLSMTCYEAAVADAVVKYDDVLSGKIRAYQKPIDDRWGL